MARDLELCYGAAHAESGKTHEWKAFVEEQLGISVSYAGQPRLYAPLEAYPGLLRVPSSIAEMSRCAASIKTYLDENPPCKRLEMM